MKKRIWNVQGSDWGNQQEIEEEAARLSIRLQSEPDEAERSRIYDWIDAHPSHAVAFARAEAVWEQSKRLKASHHPSEGDAETALYEPAGSSPRRSYMIGGMIAASLLLAGVGMSSKFYGKSFGFGIEKEPASTCSGKSADK